MRASRELEFKIWLALNLQHILYFTWLFNQFPSNLNSRSFFFVVYSTLVFRICIYGSVVAVSFYFLICMRYIRSCGICFLICLSYIRRRGICFLICASYIRAQIEVAFYVIVCRSYILMHDKSSLFPLYVAVIIRRMTEVAFPFLICIRYIRTHDSSSLLFSYMCELHSDAWWK